MYFDEPLYWEEMRRLLSAARARSLPTVSSRANGIACHLTFVGPAGATGIRMCAWTRPSTVITAVPVCQALRSKKLRASSSLDVHASNAAPRGESR